MDEDRPPFEREVAAMVLGVRDLAAPQRRAAEAAAAVAHDALRTATAALGDRVSPLTALGDELALSPLARDLLVLIAAPGLWGELARLYGILANDEHRAVCDEQLLVELCRGRVDRHAIGRELDRDQPLVRHGVVHVAADRARPFAALAVDPLVLKLLRADPLDADLDAGTRLIPVTRTLDQLRVPRAALARVVAALAADDAPARLVIRGRAGAGGRTVAATLAARAGRTLGAVDAARLLREQRLDLLGLHLRRCALRGWLPLIEGLETIASDDAVVRERVRDVVRDHPGPLVLRLPRDATPPVDPGFVALDLPATSVAERADHWQAVLGRRGLAVRDVDELAARFAIGPGLIERVAAQVDAARGDAADAGALVDVELDDGVRQHLASQLGQVATRVGRLANWSQVILPPDILDSVLELISRIRHRRVVYDTWGFDRVMSTSRGVTALFQGGPGTGKTMVASAIANDLGLDLYRVDLSRVMSKWIGETEQNLARVFDAAEDGQAILLFDEADSLFAKRTKVQSSVDRYANLEVNYLLQRFDSFEGIAILTTNFGTAIDPAFKRRLSFRLTFPFPDDETRELLWKAHLPEDLPRQGPLDLADLARRYRMSGGYIRNAALRAAFLAAEEHATLSQDHLERAIRAEFREIGKLADTGVLE
ncbi:MAG: ATP-binding protein [Kofleriaceae bacterium]|nr:ATP-binding protein [Kofleriaceae bacterium]